MMSARKRPRLWTMPGLSRLGKEIKRSREELGWSQDKVVEVIRERTGEDITKQTISRLERGGQMPEHNTLAILAAAQFICSSSGKLYTESQLSGIASEALNPDSDTEELPTADDEEEAALQWVQTAPLEIVAKAIALGTARLQLSVKTSAILPISNSLNLINNDVDFVGCENMRLSELADYRLGTLLKVSLAGYNENYLQAALDGGMPQADAKILAKVLQRLVMRQYKSKFEYTDNQMVAIANLCYRVKRWRSDDVVEVEETKYAGDVEQLIVDLERAIVNNHHQTH